MLVTKSTQKYETQPLGRRKNVAKYAGGVGDEGEEK